MRSTRNILGPPLGASKRSKARSISSAVPLLFHTLPGGVAECSATVLADGKIFTPRGECHQLTKNFGDLTYELKSGKTVWQKDFVKDLGAERVPNWGYSASPLLAQGRSIVNPGGKAARVQ